LVRSWDIRRSDGKDGKIMQRCAKDLRKVLKVTGQPQPEIVAVRPGQESLGLEHEEYAMELYLEKKNSYRNCGPSRERAKKKNGMNKRKKNRGGRGQRSGRDHRK